MTIIYAVRAEFSEPGTRVAYLDWITGGHAAAVVAAGARSVQVVTCDDGSLDVRYSFDDREALAAYEAGPAVELRADGAARFPAGSVVITRSVGEVVMTG